MVRCPRILAGPQSRCRRYCPGDWPEGSGGTPSVDNLVQYLRDRHILLVLDNFEQVMDAVPLVSELLAAAPNL